MTGIPPVGVSTAPVTPSKNNDASVNEIKEAVDNNSKVAKNCAVAALATSCATLIPLSVLAVKTGKISKVAEKMQQGVQPVLDNVQRITSDLSGATGAIKGATESVKLKTEEVLGLIKSEEMKGFIETLKSKVHEIDGKAVGGELKASIAALSDAAKAKVGEVDAESINNLLVSLKNQVDNLNIPELKTQFGQMLENSKLGQILGI